MAQLAIRAVLLGSRAALPDPHLPLLPRRRELYGKPLLQFYEVSRRQPQPQPCLQNAPSATAVSANRPPGCDELKRHFLNVLRIGCHACLSHAQVVEQVDRLMVLRRQTGWDSAAAAAMLEVRSSNWVPCILRWRNTVPRRYGTT